MRVIGAISACVVVAACAAPGDIEEARQLDPCATEYLAAFSAGRRLEVTEGCNWGELVDQNRSDRIQADVASAHPAGGVPVGYKVTNAQDGRVVGVVTDAMLLPSGSTIDLSTGTRLLGEGDLLVRVKSGAINDARMMQGHSQMLQRKSLASYRLLSHPT